MLYEEANEVPNEFYSSVLNQPMYQHVKIIKRNGSDSKKFYSIHEVKTLGSSQSFQLVLIFQDTNNLNETKLTYYIIDKKNTSFSDMLVKAIVAAESIDLLLGLYDKIASTASTIDVTANASLSTTSIISKSLLAVIIVSIVTAGGGIMIGDAYFSDPTVEYYVYPEQMPAELHGMSLEIMDVYSTDEKSEIINYDCDNESVVHDLNYSFECVTENSLGNKESVTTTVSVKAPNNKLDADAIQCVEQYYYPLSDEFTNNYTYLSNLPNASPGTLSDYKNTHIKLMDDYFENHDYANAKKHATIVLKYFNINDIQALSTLGNVMRDEDRTDVNGVQCAIAVHSTPFISHTAWGKLSLADNYHVLGDYDTSTYWSSQVIDGYVVQVDDEIHEISYVNSLIVKANALYRQALVEQSEFDQAKMYYNLAHDITPSYDTWFGLGNIDRHEGNFEGALEKYERARELASDDTTEINDAINRVLVE